MAKKTKDIPVHQLRDRSTSGFEVDYFAPGDEPDDEETLGAHRDDHYLFFIIDRGSGSFMIDFTKVELHAIELYYILPGQVHHRINNEFAGGWFLAVDTLLIPPDHRAVFEGKLLLQQPVTLTQQQLKQCHNVLALLCEKNDEEEQQPFQIPIMHALIQAFSGLAAGYYSNNSSGQTQVSRPAQLSRDFKKLLSDNIYHQKSPSAYAAQLNVSESYLNEVVKKTTGYPVSQLILQEVMLEAKRLLYHSQLNVKQIAHHLGYQDHAYFSRLFSKAEGTTPLTFRAQVRK